MRYTVPSTTTGLHCCKVDCPAPAVWELTTGPSYEDVTHSCAEHVGEMLDGGPLVGIACVNQERHAVDTLDVVFDGPPSAESGRFVELEGFYGYEPGRLGPRGVGGPEWIEDGEFWRLRIQVPAGWLVG